MTISSINPSVLTASIISLMGLGLLANPTPVHAAIINGNFNSNLNQWTAKGDVSNFQGQALLTTASLTNADDFPQARSKFNFSGTEVSSIDQLENFLSINSFDFGANATEGSALKQTFTAQAGDVISFKWKVMTNEEIPDVFDTNDAAFLTLKNLASAVSNVTLLTDTNGTFAFSSDLGFEKQTKFQIFKSQPLAAGDYTLGLAIIDDGDTSVTSALLVDDIKIQPVPEPPFILGLGAALGFIFLQKCRRYC